MKDKTSTTSESSGSTDVGEARNSNSDFLIDTTEIKGTPWKMVRQTDESGVKFGIFWGEYLLSPIFPTGEMCMDYYEENETNVIAAFVLSAIHSQSKFNNNGREE